MRISDWSSDVCSSDLLGQSRQPQKGCAQGDPASAKGLLWKPAQAASQTSCSPSSNGPTVSGGISGPACSGASRSVCSAVGGRMVGIAAASAARKASRSEEHTSELQSLMRISYAVFCLKKQNTKRHTM